MVAMTAILIVEIKRCIVVKKVWFKDLNWRKHATDIEYVVRGKPSRDNRWGCHHLLAVGEIHAPTASTELWHRRAYNNSIFILA